MEYADFLLVRDAGILGLEKKPELTGRPFWVDRGQPEKEAHREFNMRTGLTSVVKRASLGILACHTSTEP